MSEKKTNLYAVYGSLRKGLGNHPVLGDSKLVGECKTPPTFTMFSMFGGGFPGVIKSGNTSIVLEVYEAADARTEQRLDNLEGYRGPNNPRNFYNKELIDTPYGKAYIYYINSSTTGLQEVESGDWKQFKENK